MTCLRQDAPRDAADKGWLPLEPLKNRYFVMRHGKSEANAAGLIVSDPCNGCLQYGLTPEGRAQAAESGQKLRQQLGDTASAAVVVCCSDFKRTLETAEVLLEALGRAGEPPVICTWLRERCSSVTHESRSCNHVTRVSRPYMPDANHINAEQAQMRAWMRGWVRYMPWQRRCKSVT